MGVPQPFGISDRRGEILQRVETVSLMLISTTNHEIEVWEGCQE
jgi:hypothetical protein